MPFRNPSKSCSIKAGNFLRQIQFSQSLCNLKPSELKDVQICFSFQFKISDCLKTILKLKSQCD